MSHPTVSSQIDPRVSRVVPGFTAPFFLAGLVGYSDGAMRMVSRMHGAPFCVTESMRPDVLLRGGKGLERANPDRWEPAELERWARILDGNSAAGAGDHPLAAQIIGDDPDPMAEAAALLAELPYEVVDVNLACPPKRKRGASCQGGALLADVDRAIAILRAVRDAVPPEVPTTVKLRRAYDDTDEMASNFDVIFDAVYEHGYAWATVHCRTVLQRYDGPGRWPFLTDLTARHPDRIIFGSGDVWTARDVVQLLAQTGVHAAAVARGGIANPWIFRQAHELLAGKDEDELEPPTPAEMRLALEEHHRLSRSLNGPVTAPRMMRKFAIKLCEKYLPEEAKRRFIATKSLDDWEAALDAVLGSPVGSEEA